MINENDLDQLVKEIFVDSFKRISFGDRYWDISPFNVEKVKKELVPIIDKEYKNRVPHCNEILNTLDQLSSAITEAGRITKEIYEKHHFALNNIARVQTHTDIKISGGYYHLEDEDQKSREIGASHTILLDGEYGEMTGKYGYYPNIFGDAGEGTLFQREYDGTGVLTKFRIFHQLHRNSLKIATINLDTLQTRIVDLIKERNEGKRKVDLSLPYDANTFAYEKLTEFNQAFGDYITLNVFSISGSFSKPILVAEFKEDHSSAAQTFIDLQEQHGISLNIYPKDNFTTVGKDRDYQPLDFDDRVQIDRDYPQKYRLDNTHDSILTYLILSKPPTFLPPLLKAYILHKSSIE